MLVQQILKHKNDDAVVTVRPELTMAEAVSLLSERRIGAVVVSGDGKVPEGILSERDVVRELGRRGGEVLATPVTQVMTARISTCTREDTADTILATMTEGRFRHIPVMEGGRMVGLISIGDVVKARLAELSMERDALQGMVMGY